MKNEKSAKLTSYVVSQVNNNLRVMKSTVTAYVKAKSPAQAIEKAMTMMIPLPNHSLNVKPQF